MIPPCVRKLPAPAALPDEDAGLALAALGSDRSKAPSAEPGGWRELRRQCEKQHVVLATGQRRRQRIDDAESFAKLCVLRRERQLLSLDLRVHLALAAQAVEVARHTVGNVDRCDVNRLRAQPAAERKLRLG